MLYVQQWLEHPLFVPRENNMLLYIIKQTNSFSLLDTIVYMINALLSNIHTAFHRCR